MATCKDCLYYEVCIDFRNNICSTDQERFEEYKINSDGLCDRFKNKADFVEVKHGEWIIAEECKTPLSHGYIRTEKTMGC